MPGGVTCGFVVLHYQSYEMTEKCVATLIDRFGNQAIYIVVVDNGSPNGSGALLTNRFGNTSKVVILLNSDNLGFAQGNNAGYVWLKQNCDPDYIVVMNNDVLIEQEDFIEQIQYAYQARRFAVLGPDIYEPATGLHRNPYRTDGYRKEEAAQLLSSMRSWDKLFPSRFLQLCITSYLKARRGQDAPINPAWRDEQVGCMLQGSCYVFSRTYTSVRSIAFCPNTFLYFEEAILWRDCQKLELPMLYWPGAKVIHLGSVSTRFDNVSNYRREKNKNHEHLKSVQVFIDRYDDMDVCDK